MLTKLPVGYDLCVDIPISRLFCIECQNRFFILHCKSTSKHFQRGQGPMDT